MNANSIYQVPKYSHDDLFWIVATIAPQKFYPRRSPIYAITNDNMKDHKVLFPSVNLFVRWRLRHTLPFINSVDLPAANTSTSDTTNNPTSSSTKIDGSSNQVEQVRNKPISRVTLGKPGKLCYTVCNYIPSL
jgi:hypothetical protein